MDLKSFIKEKRPNLSPSSIITYNSILKNLYKNVFGKDEELNTKKFEETTPILTYLKNVPSNKRKTTLSALVIITDDKKYRDLMLEDIKTYNQEIGKQEKSQSQEDNWVEGAEVKALWEKLKRNADLLYKKGTLTNGDLQNIQSFIILSLLGGIFIPPRRSKDFTDFKIKSVDKSKDNYIEKSSLIFNSYKTSKFYGEQKVAIPTQLKNILQKWIKNNPTDTLLFDTNGSPLTSVKLNQRLNKLFDGKKVGVNLLRHTYLTDKYGEHDKVEKALSNDMTEMGSSSNMAKTYIKE
jgi:integrase